MKEYKKRIVDEMLKRKLLSRGAVVIQGPKWCGKTMTGEQMAKSRLYLDDPESRDINIIEAETHPKKLLSGETPRLIDEWQLAPKLWDAIRFEVDHRENSEGQFILTGSSVPIKSDEITHSGVGRFSYLTMHTMSLYESGESDGSVSLSSLFDDPPYLDGKADIDSHILSFLIERGGWPGSISKRDNIALDDAKDYFDVVIKKDIYRNNNDKLDEDEKRTIMKSISRNIGCPLTLSSISKDISSSLNSSFSIDRTRDAVEELKNIFVLENMKAWNPNLRSKTAIRTTEVVYFTDPSIAMAALGIGGEDLLKDLNTFSFFFESLCVRDLRVYALSFDGDVYHYRDKSGLECDAVIKLRNGKYGLCEIKLGGDKLIEEGAVSLKKLSNNIDDKKMNKPSFLMVLVGIGNYAYKRKDGVFVVPVTLLKP